MDPISPGRPSGHCARRGSEKQKTRDVQPAGIWCVRPHRSARQPQSSPGQKTAASAECSFFIFFHRRARGDVASFVPRRVGGELLINLITDRYEATGDFFLATIRVARMVTVFAATELTTACLIRLRASRHPPPYPRRQKLSHAASVAPRRTVRDAVLMRQSVRL